MVMIPRTNKAAETAAASSATQTVAAPAAQTAQTAAAPATQTVQQPVQQANVPAVQQGGAVSAKVAKPMRNAVEEIFKNKIPLEWNTLHRVQANQGSFLDLENNKQEFARQIIVQLMTYQPNWQISPGTDNPADTELVRYSDDGLYTKQGEPCAEYVAALIKAGYEKAKMSARYTMAFVIEEVVGDPGNYMTNKIVQIDLASTSKSAFDQFMMENGYKESRGLIPSEVAESGRLKLTTKVKTQAKMSWTVVQFENAA